MPAIQTLKHALWVPAQVRKMRRTTQTQQMLQKKGRRTKILKLWGQLHGQPHEVSGNDERNGGKTISKTNQIKAVINGSYLSDQPAITSTAPN